MNSDDANEIERMIVLAKQGQRSDAPPWRPIKAITIGWQSVQEFQPNPCGAPFFIVKPSVKVEFYAEFLK